MPEVGPKSNPELARELAGNLSKEEAEAFAKEHGLEVVGSGGEAVVVEIGDDKERVAGIVFGGMSPEVAKSYYYRHKIFSTLFPHNFPRIYASFGRRDDVRREESDVSATIRERIDGIVGKPVVNPSDERLARLFAVFPSVRSEHDVRFPFAHVQEAFDAMEVRFGFDAFGGNFMLSEDGGEYYVDTLKPQLWNDEEIYRLLRYMKQHEYPEKDIKAVETSLERLQTISLDAGMDKNRYI